MRHSKTYRRWLLIIAFCIAAATVAPVVRASSEVMTPSNSGLDAKRAIPKAFVEGALGTAEQKTVRGVFFDVEGKELTFEDFKDKVLVLVFWAHWSLDSLTLLHGMQKVRDYLDLTDMKDVIEILPISGHADGFSPNRVEKIGVEHGLKMPLYFDQEGALFDYFEVRSVPLALIVDKRGKVIYRVKGYMKWDSVAVVKQLLTIATTESSGVLPS
ncbi:TlpA family protein disulfide reductase [Anaplasma bovis]|uniref:TlpA family protein disulfide reductase n=1 Tax=Anaplasma bovis TaxID=186733 RepID=UPI002FEF307D